MRTVLSIALLLILTACGGDSEIIVGNKTTMEIISEYDAGDVIKGEVITAKFSIKNTGEYPLVIGEVKGSCSCTVAESPGEPILPGESGDVVAYVNTDKVQEGPLHKSVRIVSNTEPSVTEVIIKGNVMRK
ncbi:MAG TPA: DUF1573 domain-containing protein [Crocinitomicaceae bacterium]|nr:DUF1573 domain-containing protein [Crocinitomicaceae bacterium]